MHKVCFCIVQLRVVNTSNSHFLQFFPQWWRSTFLAMHHCLSCYSMLGLFLTTTLRTTVLDWLLRLHASQATEVRTFALWWHSKETHISHFIVETAAPNCPIPPNHGLSLLISVECECVKHYPGPSPGFCSRGAENRKWGTFFSYNIGCMQQPGANMKWTGPPLATTLVLSLSALFSQRCLEGITFQTERLNRRNLCVSPKSQIFSQPSNLKLWT